jgi:hypothetical protein
MKTKKTFDCVAMKRSVQERVYAETRGLTPDQELDYFHKAAEQFWAEVARLREERTATGSTPTPRAG